MKGYRCVRKGGWDTHGLPVELEVEKELGFTTKREIEEYGIDRFNALCRESVMRYKGEWEELTERVGFWIDLDDPYVTYHNGYIQTGWWIIKELWDRGLVYLGYRVTPHCPRCVTSLSSHEVSLGYKEDTPDPSIYVRFPLEAEQDAGLNAARRMGWSEAGWDGAAPAALAWTTTPWTLTANMALAVAPDEDYVLMRSPDSGERALLVRARVEDVLGEGWTEEAAFKGSELQGLRYSPPFENATEHEGAPFHHRILPADYVGVEDGTGIVHTAPAYGAEDYDLGRQFGLPTHHTVDMLGVLAEGFPGGGTFVKEADADIRADLERRGLLYRDGTMTHTYPFCWRCDTPLLYYAKPSWYIRTTAHKDDLVAMNREISWYPGHFQEGRFGEWLRNNVDWAISRERYWGTPIPVWRCEQCGHDECFGDLDALRERATPETRGVLEPEGLDLHRPYIDSVVVPCAACGGEARRTPEVLDCWFDSGAMPYAQFHFPHGAPELFSDGRFPADYICEGVDQTRGWFYSLHALSVLLRNDISYRNVICLGLILDGEGEKMSKTKGNIVEPWAVINAHGADAVRWYLLTAAPPGNSRRFSQDLVEESVRRFLLTLWNTYSFFVTYARLDEFDPTASGQVEPTAELDRWVLSELNQLVSDVTEELDGYNPTDAGRKIEAFVEELSTWYVRRSRRRFWKSENDGDKRSAYQTLYTCLVTLSKLLAPLTPFVAEEMYQNLVTSVDPEAPDSVHLAAFPEADESRIDDRLDRAVRLAMRIASLGRNIRSKSGVKVRQPLARVLVSPREGEEELLPLIESQVLDELNVKAMEVAAPETFAQFTLKPNLPVLGPKLGASMGAARQAIAEADAAAVAAALRSGGYGNIQIGGFTFEPGDFLVEVEDMPGIATASEGALLVGIETTLTPELRQEGLARELVHNIQNMRRSAGLDIADRIVVTHEGAAELQALLGAGPLGDYVRGETLTVEAAAGSPGASDYSETLKIEGLEITIGVRKA
ncbi:MAG: isoleucine--tRNA ligase [Chloroflexota bacterium]|nr:isoleucine--tRNA ligase [Chloroflexota bacterium]